MAQKSGNRELVEYIPSMERDDPKPFTVNFIPLSKGAYDSYINSLGEYKRNKFISHVDQAFRLLCEKTLTPNKDGVFLKNNYHTSKNKLETFYSEVKDKELAIEMLCGLTNIELANEIESVMKSQSSLDEEEIKN